MGNNVTNFKTTPSAETIYLSKALKEMGHEVDIISLKDGEYTIAFESVEDINGYERLLVINGSANFFGGAPNFAVLKAQQAMAAYKSKIYYLLTDVRLNFSQTWPAIQNKEWVSHYSEETLMITSPIKIVSQGVNLDVAKKIHKKALTEGTTLEYEYFPLEQYKIHDDTFEFSSPEEKTVDLIYGGSFRGGQREAKMVEFLFDTGLNVEFFGTAKATQFKSPKFHWEVPPEFTGKIPMDQVSEKNSSGIATLIIGDKNYNDNFITLRVWETLASDAVVLIDEEFDTKHRIIQDDRFYVKNRAELIERIEELKSNDELRREMISIQHKVVLDTQARKAEWQSNFAKVLDM